MDLGTEKKQMLIKQGAYAFSNRLTLIFVFLTSFSLLAIKTRGEYISPWDEMYHLSYIQYLFQGQIPKFGDSMNSWSRNGFSCRPVYPFGMVTQVECGSQGEASMYPEGGTNTASIWPPVFYAVVSVFMKIVLPIIGDPILSARLICAGFWALGVTLIAWTLLKRGIDKLLVFATSLLLSSLQFAVFNGAFITPHASVPLLVGAFLSLGFSVNESRTLNWRLFSLLFLFGLTLTVVVPHAITLALVLAAWLVFYHLHKLIVERNNFLSSLIIISVAMTVPIIGYVVNKFWNEWQASRTTSFSEQVNLGAITPSVDPGFGGNQIVEAFWKFLPHSIDGYQFLGPRSLLISQIWAVIALSFLIYQICYQKNFIVLSLIVAIGVVGILASIAFEYMLPIVVPPRYGLAIGVLLIATIPFGLNQKRSRNLFIFLAIATVVFATTLKPFVS